VKVPISRKLTDSLITPFFAITSVALYDLYSTGQKRFDLNILILIIWGVPTILISWFLIDKRTDFKKITKVRRAQRLFKLPIYSSSAYIFFIVSSLCIFGGLGSMYSNNNFSFGLPLLLIGLVIFLLIAISIDHPKIWFKDSFNVEDDLDRYKNTPKENFPAYQDGVFTYSENSFTILLDKKNKTIFWNEISSIKAYKVDEFIVDCIIIEIYVGDRVIKIDDQTTGHMKFMETAENKLCNFEKNWFMMVAFPPFETSLTVIYDKQSENKK
jgi:hypothetical protein